MTDRQTSERLVAAKALCRVETGGYAGAVLDQALEQSGLEPRQRALATRLVYGVTSCKYRLDEAVDRLCGGRPLSVQVRTILRLGLYQLAFCDGIPASAAVNETVKLAGPLRQIGATGLCNAVLRRFLREGKPLYEGEDLSVRYSVEPWIAKLWQKRYGGDTCRALLEAFAGEFPTFVRVNTQKTTAPALLARWRAAGIPAAETGCENALRLEAAGRVPDLPGFAEGLFHVQDLSSQYCALALGAKPGERVIDFCAAPGGKSFTLAQMMGDEGELLACDLQGYKATLIAEGSQRLGLSAVRAQVHDARQPFPGGEADRILCDVPCSGLGVMGKKPDLRYKRRDEVKDLPSLQLDILKNAAEHLRVGGELVYSTCTLNPAENQGVFGKFLRDDGRFVRVPIEPACPGAVKEEETLTLFPHKTGTDGFFMAKCRRVK